MLTRRERAVLEALCRPGAAGDAFGEPASVREMAGALGVTEAAVKQHLLRLYEKFDMWDTEGRSRRVLLANEVVRRGVLVDAREPEADALAEARCALESREWEVAYDLLSAAGRAGALAPADLAALGEAAMWTMRDEECVAAFTRAHTAFLDAGDARGAARTAVGIAAEHFARLRMAVAAGWLSTAMRLVDGQDCAEAGIAAAFIALMEALTGQVDTALDRARAAQATGRRAGDADSEALGLVVEGVALSRAGRIAAANSCLDQAMARAAAGQLSPLLTAIVYCRTISTCLDLFDYTRAQEWTEEISRLEESTTRAGFPGDCRTHRAAVHAVAGRWSDGEEEATLACADRCCIELSHTMSAHTTLGDIRLRRGDLDGAEHAYARVMELGGQPEPGWSLLLLARDDVPGAHASICAAVAGARDGLARARHLPALVRIAVASDDLEGASSAAAEMDEIAGRFATAALRAAASQARGSVELAHARPVQAVGPLRAALAAWREARAPYEAAEAQVTLGSALRALGDRTAAATQFRAAADSFDSLGAAHDAAGARRLATDL